MNIPSNYQHHIDEIKLIETSDIKSKGLPVAQFIKECYDLQLVVEEDCVDLQKLGLSESLLKEFPERLDILQQAESDWQAAKHKKAVLMENHADLKKSLINECRELREKLRFTFRNNPKQLKKLIMPEGKNTAMYVQYLCDRLVQAEKRFDEVKRFIDREKLDSLNEYSSKIGAWLAVGSVENRSRSEERVFRDASFHYLKHLRDEICTAGRFLFRNDHLKLERYTSNYISKRNHKNRK